MIGRRFGKLTVVARDTDYRSPSGGIHKRYICKCDCGNYITVMSDNLKRTQSCGCVKKLSTAKVGKANLKHGGTSGSRERLYNIWSGMKSRCYNEKDTEHYKRYGARGVSICDEWRNSYEAFRDWALSNGYHDDLSIDRIDVNGNYEPSNCRWATNKEQQNNLRTNRVVTINGENYTVAQLANKYSAPYRKLLYQLNKGCNAEELVKYAKRFVWGRVNDRRTFT